MWIITTKEIIASFFNLAINNALSRLFSFLAVPTVLITSTFINKQTQTIILVC